MSRAMTAPVLEPVGQGEVALQSVRVEARIENLLSEVTIEQVYSNLEDVNIEAVYTFPLPLGAVLLDMTIQTAAKRLKGVVVGKKEAEGRYEDAITDGDTAIMLEQVDPGLYTMNVGNLLPEETITISITYAELLTWRNHSLRFFLPTTVAPRYGDPSALGIQPHQATTHDLLAKNRFSLTVSICGALAWASIESPSHQIVSSREAEKTVVSLKKGLMDRDFVLNISMASGEKSFVHLERDGNGYVALASFQPMFATEGTRAAKCITIIVDCSGSMGGDSIAQAREALREILELLRPGDWFNVIRFGSSHEELFPAPVRAEGANLNKARQLLETLDADMGGTEIGTAIAGALEEEAPGDVRKDVLLITDGEIWDWEEVTALAAEYDYRFFTVGVGASVSEAFVQTLAEVTGGACELVSPNEDMAEKIVRHFKRIYLPRASNVQILWPGRPVKMIPEQIASIYAGDTLHAFARFDEKPAGDVELRADLENGEPFAQKLHIQTGDQWTVSGAVPGTTSRMAAAVEIRSLSDVEPIEALAVKYQLMSPHTNYLAIDVRSEKERAEDLPELRQTPQMMAAGWGGAGTVKASVAASIIFEESCDMSLDLEEPRFSRRKSIYYERIPGDYGSLEDDTIKQMDNFVNRLNECFEGFGLSWLLQRGRKVSSIADLVRLGVPEEVVEELNELVAEGADEKIVVAMFLYQLSREEEIKESLSRTTLRIIAKSFKQLPAVSSDLQSKIAETVSLCVESG